jgi:aldehyde dehydrogenase (NAD+)
MQHGLQTGYDLPPEVTDFLAAGPPKQLLIGGEWQPSSSGETLAAIDPSTGRELAQFQTADAEDVDRAVRAARAAVPVWGGMAPRERQLIIERFAELVEQHAQQLWLIDSLDGGVPVSISLAPAQGESLAWKLRYHASLGVSVHGTTPNHSLNRGMGSYLAYTLKEPVGVAGVITPWNLPTSTVIMKIAPALAAGCPVVLKPSEDATLSAIRIAELACEAGFPDGVLNLVTGLGAVAGAAIASHPDVDKVSFTGSVPTGQAIVEASKVNLKKVTLELGGKSPNFVFADADLSRAIPESANAVFWNTGQVCSAGTRLFVQREIYDEFVDGLVGVAESLIVGPSLDESTQIGPLVSKRQMERVLGYLDAGREDGATLAVGGERLVDGKRGDGYFVGPTIFTGLDDGMRVSREEIFGPVLAVMPFDTEEEAVHRGNASQYGLSAYVWTESVGRLHRMAAALEVGFVWANCHYMALDLTTPFGGNKMSGYGREGGAHALDEFLTEKTVVLRTD